MYLFHTKNLKSLKLILMMDILNQVHLHIIPSMVKEKEYMILVHLYIFQQIAIKNKVNLNDLVGIHFNRSIPDTKILKLICENIHMLEYIFIIVKIHI